MAAQSASNSRPSLGIRRSSTSSSTNPMKTKRARTKHACDECRRSQKKCDGDKPLCRRCYLNGTQCTYTPHKSRSQCACIGQVDELRPDVCVPDVFIFPDSSASSFHTWSATSSPDQSPGVSVSAFDTPSPTNPSQDEGLDPAHATDHRCSALTYATELEYSPAVAHRNHNSYSRRSYSLPDVSCPGSSSPSPRTACFSSTAVSTSLPSFRLEHPYSNPEPTITSQAEFSSSRAGGEFHFSNPATYGQLAHSLFDPANPIFDHDSRYEQPSSVGLGHGHLAFSDGDQPPLQTPFQQPYDTREQGWSRPAQNIFSTGTQTPGTENIFSYASLQDLTTSQHIPQSNAPVICASSHTQDWLSTMATPHQFHASEVHNILQASLPNQAIAANRQSVGHLEYAHSFAHTLGSNSSAELQNADTLLANLSSPPFSQTRWDDQSVNTSTSTPSSAYSSPSAYGSNDIYEWSR